MPVLQICLGHLPGAAGVLMRFCVAAAQIQWGNQRRAKGHAVRARFFADHLIGFHGDFAVRIAGARGAAKEKIVGDFHARAAALGRVCHKGIQRGSLGIQAVPFAGKAAVFVVEERFIRRVGDALELLFVGEDQSGMAVI